MSFPTLKDGSRNWCATCKHDDGVFCEFGECCMYQQNADGTYNHDLPPTKYEEENRMSEQEVKIFMDDNGRLFAVTEDGERYILVPYERNGVFAE